MENGELELSRHCRFLSAGATKNHEQNFFLSPSENEILLVHRR